MMTLDDAAAIASGLPGVTVGTKYGNRTWLVGEKFFAITAAYHSVTPPKQQAKPAARSRRRTS